MQDFFTRLIHGPWRAIVTIGLAGSIFSQSIAQQAESNNQAAGPELTWRQQRAALEHPFENELTDIADWCRQNGLDQQVSPTLQLAQRRDRQRQYLFLPGTQQMPDPLQQPDALRPWQEKINQAQVNHAERIFQLAQQAAAADAVAIAFQLLHEVVFHDRDHAVVRKILGHRQKQDGWKVASDWVRPKTSTVDHDFLPFKRGQFIVVKTPHFEIESTAGEARTRSLANDLEKWHGIWRQLFFSYWCRKSRLIDALAGKKQIKLPKRKFKVFFFSNKAEYVNALRPRVPGVELSSGYYAPQQRVSFFYHGRQAEKATWRHELTHQLFRESARRSPAKVFENNFIWLDEGVATYFESMTELDGYVTMGGFDALRLQFARKQALLEGRALKIAELNGLSQSAWQARADADLYAQSAAIVDMLVNDQDGRYEQRFVRLLKTIYPKQARPSSLTKELQLSTSDLDQRYLDYLNVDAETVTYHLLRPKSRTFLCLPNAGLDKAAFARLAECSNLAELCFSQQTVAADDIAPLKDCRSIEKLIIIGCALDSGVLTTLGGLPNLTELNLTYSQYPAQELTALRAQRPQLIITQQNSR